MQSERHRIKFLLRDECSRLTKGRGAFPMTVPMDQAIHAHTRARTTHNAQRTTHAPCTTHMHAPRTTHPAPRTPHIRTPTQVHTSLTNVIKTITLNLRSFRCRHFLRNFNVIGVLFVIVVIVTTSAPSTPAANPDTTMTTFSFVR